MLNRFFLCLAIVSSLMLAGCLIQGRVIDKNGEGVACIRVLLSGDQTRATTTNSEGYYTFGDLNKLDIIPAGNYTVTPSKYGCDFFPASIDVPITTQLYPDTEDYYVPWPVFESNFWVATPADGDAYRMCGVSATLRWQAAAGAEGYKVYYMVDRLPVGSGPPYDGFEAAEGASPIDVGNETSFTLNLAATGHIRFAVTAYNEHGESGFSEEVGWR